MTAPTVMIVDDDPDILEAMAMVLEGCGYAVIVAPDGRRALDLLHDGARPALIILDLMMPGMDGWAFRAEQRRNPELATIPVVILSGDSDVVHRAAGLQVAAALCKPVDVDTLVAAVEQHRYVNGQRSLGG